MVQQLTTTTESETSISIEWQLDPQSLQDQFNVSPQI